MTTLPIAAPPINPMIRNSALDGIRGMAMLMVIFGHMVGTLGLLGRWSFYDHYYFPSPLHFFTNETDAVIIFFLLSGFVMHLPFTAPTRDVGYTSFWGRRFFRLYPLHLLALIFCMLVYRELMNAAALVEFNPQLEMFTHQPSWAEFMRELVPISPNLHDSGIDAPMWSLFVEFKASVIFPVIIILARRLEMREFLILTGCIWVLCTKHQPETIKYLPFFALGAFGAQYHQRLLKFIPRQKALQLAGLLICLCLFESRFIYGISGYRFDSLTAVTSLALILLALKSDIIGKIFSLKPLTWIGRHTYPIYLLHYPFYLALLSVTTEWLHNQGDINLPPRVTAFAIAASVTFLIIFPLSALLHKTVEMPFNQLGYRIFKKLDRKHDQGITAQ